MKFLHTPDGKPCLLDARIVEQTHPAVAAILFSVPVPEDVKERARAECAHTARLAGADPEDPEVAELIELSVTEDFPVDYVITCWQ